MFEKFIAKQLSKPSGLFGRYFTFRWLEKNNTQINLDVINALSLANQDTLLEIGFGSGMLIDNVLSNQSFKKIIGLDISSCMCNLAKERFKNEIDTQKLSIIEQTVESYLKSANGQVDKIASVNTLYFWPEPELTLEACFELLKASGKIVLAFDTKDNLSAWKGHQYGFKLYELTQVTDLLTKAGFINIQHQLGENVLTGEYWIVIGEKG